MTNDISRRYFLKLTSRGVGLAVVSTGLMACFDSDNNPLPAPPTAPEPAPVPIPVTFIHGLASGDPTQTAVILWTRVTPIEDNFSGELPISWAVATDADFQDIVTNGEATISQASDYTIKVDAIDLTPDTTYYFRFTSGESTSETGVTRTLPEGAVDSIKLAVMSCSNYPAGYFNVYDMAAEQQDLNAVLHLGDYIYEYDRQGYASENAAILGREVLPDAEIVSLHDYRTRYAQYRSDASLQKLHAAVPFIAVWDDHEITNDAWRGGAENHQESEGDYEERKLVALQAYFEWMPIRPVVEGNNEIINRQFQFGNLVDLYMLDTRVVGRDEQLNYANYIDLATGVIDAASFTADVSDSNRTLLGAEQLSWLLSGMTSSTARWQLLGQQVLMGRMNLPAAVATQQLSIGEFAELAQIAILAQRVAAGDPTLTADEIAFFAANQERLTAEIQALLALPSIPYNLDAWDGYAYEREVILGTAKQLNKNLVVVAGDTHNAWANNLRDLQGEIVGVEFATASVSSPGLETVLAIAPEDVPATEIGVVQLVDDLQYFNAADRGFMIVTFTPEKVISQWHYVDTISSTEYSELADRAQTAESLLSNPAVTLL